MEAEAPYIPPMPTLRERLEGDPIIEEETENNGEFRRDGDIRDIGEAMLMGKEPDNEEIH